MTRVITPDARSEAPAGVASQRLETETFLIKRKLDEELGYGQTGESFLADEQRTLDAVQVPPYELALVLERFADPKQIDDQAFRGGFTDGKLYLYSEAAGAILCAADVADESSAEVSVTVHSFGGAPSQEDVHGAMSAHLTGELIVRTIDRGLSALHAVETVAVPVEPRHRKAR